MRFEYKVVPAPTRGKKVKGVKTAADRFAHALGEVMNEHAADGWEYLRTDTLPAEERSGLTSRTTVFQNMLVFRRPVEAAVEVEAANDDTTVEAPAPNLFADDIADAHAPKLPSAEAAQDVTSKVEAPEVGSKRDVAAE